MIHQTQQELSSDPTTLGRGPENLDQSYFQTLLRRIPWPSVAGRPQVSTLGVTSCTRGEGVSTVAANLATTAATLTASRVLLVDTNLENPTVHNSFGLSLGPGLAESLIDGTRLITNVQSLGNSSLEVLTAGRRTGTTFEAFHQPNLLPLVAALKENYDLVIFDMPATVQSSGAARLAGMLDGVLLVVAAEETRCEVAKRTKDLLTRDNTNLLGVVLNKQQQHVPNWLYRTL
jgi:capsular exopolysaccharide synthesis family protein